MADHGASHDVSTLLQHGGEHTAHDDHGIKKYIYVFIALCVLTSASFFTYSSLWQSWFHDTPQVSWAFMMAVSCTKAMLVILFFMHVKYEANWKYVLTIPCAFMSVFLVLMLVPDIGMRGRWVSEERLLYSAEPRATNHGSAQHEAELEE